MRSRTNESSTILASQQAVGAWRRQVILLDPAQTPEMASIVIRESCSSPECDASKNKAAVPAESFFRRPDLTWKIANCAKGLNLWGKQSLLVKQPVRSLTPFNIWMGLLCERGRDWGGGGGKKTNPMSARWAPQLFAYHEITAQIRTEGGGGC